MIYTYHSRVRYSEIDEHGTMTLFALVNNMQDACTFHGEEAGVGLAYNLAQHRAWIIANIQTRFDRFPEFGERIAVCTWAEQFRGLLARRNFTVETDAGELLCEAATDWLFMDRDTRNPVRIPEDQVEAYGLHPEKTLSTSLGKRKVRLPEGGVSEEPFTIQEYHLDTNLHVNNAQYIRLSQRYLPAGFVLTQMRVEFKKQALLGDQIYPRVAEGEAGEQFVALCDVQQEPYFIAEYR